MADESILSNSVHPGEILFEDQVDNRKWVKTIEEVPDTMAWVNLDGIAHPVVRIELTGTGEQMRITKYGLDNQFLETTIQARRGGR